PKKATTFQEFESITSDAWDVGDDDDELLAMAAHNLNIEVVMETANKQERRRRDDETDRAEEDEEEEAQEEEEEEEGAQEQATAEEDDDEEEEEAGSYRGEEEEEEEEEAATPETPEPGSQGDIRLVKSHSEAPIGSPRDEAGERVALHRQRSLPPRPPVIPMVARIADQNTTGTLVMTEREASRLDNCSTEGKRSANHPRRTPRPGPTPVRHAVPAPPSCTTPALRRKVEVEVAEVERGG
ncbi:hypothetical protein CRUP_018457, partial [Coryphaenoides rupestris]